MPASPKSPRRKRHVERPDVRALLLEAAEALIQEEGYAAATARRIANRVGLKHQVVFYYFGTQDELLLELYKKVAGAQWERLKAALSSEHPLSAMWTVNRNPDSTRLSLEFMALANHNEMVRKEIAKQAKKVRNMEVKAITQYLEERGVEPRLSPQMVSILCNGMARLLVQESALGIHIGHAEAEALFERSFSDFEAQGVSNDEVEPIVGAMSLTK